VSDRDRPDLEAFQHLESVIRAVGEEMAGWRRRAKVAEARVQELEREAGPTPPEPEPPPTDPRVAELERENAELRARLEGARERTQQLLNRMRFLRQQQSQAER
jgi:hypothetical protein